ncbi:hypothetical protein SAMN06265368_3521 [Cohaesibacter gelatinilyticus]|uniref:Uncharacterized protein n=1 Tax=Cohaesibacter gelatinilyticus TaxID=372072 RepID=A0A285PG45_9HYPH|nr:hypothetical protein SAMN06265368_3521 [Cohaesibacter gelatinilyticus]
MPDMSGFPVNFPACIKVMVSFIPPYHHSDLIKCQYYLTFDTSWIYAHGREDVNPWKILPLR